MLMRWTRVWTSSRHPKTLFFLIPGMDSVCISKYFPFDRCCPQKSTFTDYFELYNRIIPDCRVRKLRDIRINHSKNHKNLEIFGIEFHKCLYFLYFEEIRSSRCPNLGKYGQRNEQNKGNLFIATERDEQICGKIWWILTDIWRIYAKEYNQSGELPSPAPERALVNYPPTPKATGWASGVIDSPNGNASSRFCLT